MLSDGGAREEVPHRLLRPIYRAEENIVIDPDDWTLGGQRGNLLEGVVPIKVFHTFPHLPLKWTVRVSRPASPVVSCLVDTGLRDMLRGLRDEGGGHFALPIEGKPRLAFPAPTVVDDASYAIECAAVGEVDLVRLDAQIRELNSSVSRRSRLASGRAFGVRCVALPDAAASIDPNG